MRSSSEAPTTPAPAGWAWPSTAKKAHYFEQGEYTSVCGKWLFGGYQREDNNDSSPDNCSPCQKKIEKKRARSG